MSGSLIPKPKPTGKRVFLECKRVIRKKRSKDTSHEYCRWRREPLPKQYLINFVYLKTCVITMRGYKKPTTTAANIDTLDLDLMTIASSC